MRHWFDTLLHRLKGHFTVTVTLIGSPDAVPTTCWALDVFTEDGDLCIDEATGKELRYPLVRFDFLVTT